MKIGMNRMSLLAAGAALFCTIAGWSNPALAREDPPADRTGLEADLERALAEGRLDEALELAEQVAFEEMAEYFEARMRVVEILCLRGEKDEAVEAVREMLDAGYWDVRRLLRDEKLALLNQDESFQEMVRAAWAKQYIGMLERDSRDEMQKPAEIMATLAFSRGERVADVGAGSGYFTLPIARAVGPTGKVWAADIRQTMLDYIDERVGAEGLTNVELVLCEADDPGLPSGGVDTILMVDTIHYVKDRAAYGRKLAEALAPGGRLVIIDFRYDPDAEREFAPPLEQQVEREVLDAEMQEAGFVVAESYDFLPEQYFVVYRLAD
jgi:ubiquinone/menaquinone biosynthesis C-methylase UbiE